MGPQAAVFALLAIWAFAPLAVDVLHVARHGGVLTGVNGADYPDQFQYLAWTRDAGSHLLASNLWLIGRTPHDYLHPMYLISGLLWRLGVNVQVAYLIWKPVALVVMFFGFAAYVRRMLPGSRGRQAVALFLALFYLTPVLAVVNWTGHLSFAHRLSLIEASQDAEPALNLWGFDHAAIAVGLMPVFLICCERLLGAGGTRGSERRPVLPAAAAAAGAIVSWLHPWQGIMLLGVVAGLVVFRGPRRRYLALALPSVATALPLIYGFVLTRTDPSWRVFDERLQGQSPAPWWALLASLGPLVAIAAIGFRKPAQDREWMLVLWLVACAAVYFVLPQFPSHALLGLTLPLAVLAVRGSERARALLRAPRGLAIAAGLALVLAFTVPNTIFQGQSLRDDLAPTARGGLALQELRLTTDQASAFNYLEHARQSGGVLAPYALSLSIPGLTDRQAYAGHIDWQPPSQSALSDQFFAPATAAPLRRLILARSRAKFVIADCGAPARLATDIAAVARPVRHFGCVTVYAAD